MLKHVSAKGFNSYVGQTSANLFNKPSEKGSVP